MHARMKLPRARPPPAAGAAPEVRQRDGVASPDGGSRARTLQLQSLAAELSALSEQGAVTLGLNPNRLAPSSGSGPQQAQCGESPRPAAGAADGSGSKPSSPFRRAFSLMGLGRSGSPPPSGSSPAAAAARHQQGSPRLARLLGRGGSGGLSSAAAEHTPEATYELPQEQQQRRSEKAALRSNNSAGNSEAGGSRPGSPSERNFRLGSCGVPAPPTENRSRPTSPVKQLSGGGRPRTGGSATSSAAAAPRPQPSPRRPEKVWKPL